VKELIQWWRGFLKQKGSKGSKGRVFLPRQKGLWPTCDSVF
jgi:hypothetical protein